jgi:pimeloyl-ACP methyl ester carboxylesterase
VDPRPTSGETVLGPLIRTVGLDLWAHHQLGASASSLTKAVVGGLVGHRADWERHAPVMSWRSGLKDVTTEQVLADALPLWGHQHPIDVVVLVHGLLVDEQNWTLATTPVPEFLQRMLGWCPLMVRYNSGRHIASNGEDLARLLAELHQVWGRHLGRIRVIGHSMGGLVSRSALEHLRRQNADVLERVDQLYLLATPNHGADLERLGHAAEYVLESAAGLPRNAARLLTRRTGGADPGVLHALAESTGELATVVTGAPFRTVLSLLAARSDGMRDVRFGYMMPEEWQSAEHDRRRFMLNHSRPLPPPPHVRVHAVAGSLWPDSTGEPSRLRTDGLVSVASAAGIGEFDDLGVAHTSRFAEMPLLVHQLVGTSPRVLQRIVGWARG